MTRAKTREEFIKESIIVHGDKYDYSKVEYVNSQTKVTILCKVHGEFQQVPSSHKLGNGCKLCANEIKSKKTQSSYEYFLKRVLANPHNLKYDYTSTVYKGSNVKVEVLCPDHGMFSCLPGNLYKGSGCKHCGIEKFSKNNRDTTNIFIEKAIAKHKDLCDYSLVSYINSQTKVKIICKKHGLFETRPNTHLSGPGTGCLKCARENNSSRFRKDTNYFINRAVETHGDYYNYDKVDYISEKSKVEIVCQKHGSFWQYPRHHYAGSGCSSCQNYGYRENLKGFVYLLQSENLVKIGISNRHPEVRKVGIEKSSNINFNIVRYWEFENGSIPKMLENNILKYLQLNYKNPDQIFDGFTECFLNVDVNLLIKEIERQLWQ